MIMMDIPMMMMMMMMVMNLLYTKTVDSVFCAL